MKNIEFEKVIKKYFKIDNFLTFGRASLGIYIALKAWGKTGKVAIPACICHDVIAAILLSGNEPLFCDVDVETGMPTINDWNKAYQDGAHTAIVVHLFGNSAQTELVKKIFKNKLVIDDAAQALGTKTNYGFAGEAGDVGVYSFGYSKQLEVGGGLLTFKDRNFRLECERLLELTTFLQIDQIKQLKETFRLTFNSAKTNLINSGSSDFFTALLDKYKESLLVSWNPEWSEPISYKLQGYEKTISMRRSKVNAWMKVIKDTQFITVGMKETCVPWRFACRLPKYDWIKQNNASLILRKSGLEVSNWYLPGNYFVSNEKKLNTEKFSQEIFQFWIDESITVEQISKVNLRKLFDKGRNL